MRLAKPSTETQWASRRTKMPINDPAQYEMEDEMGSEKEEYFLPWPSDTNDKPFMTYDKLMTGAPGKAVK